MFFKMFKWVNLKRYLDGNCGTKNGYVCEKLKTNAANTDTFVQPLSFGDGKPCPDGYSTFGGKFIHFIFIFTKNTKLIFFTTSLINKWFH